MVDSKGAAQSNAKGETKRQSKEFEIKSMEAVEEHLNEVNPTDSQISQTKKETGAQQKYFRI